MESLNPNSTQGKAFLYPKVSALASDKSFFAVIAPTHSFLEEPVLENIILPFLKSGCFTFDSLSGLLSSSPLFLVLWKQLVLLRDLDFSRFKKLIQAMITKKASLKTDPKTHNKVPKPTQQLLLLVALLLEL